MALVTYSASVIFAGDLTKDVDVSGTLQDARSSVPALYDPGGNLTTYSIQAINSSTLRITSEIPLTGTYLLVVVGNGAIVPPSPAPASASFTPPDLDVYNTYAEARDKLLMDQDLQDQTFITPRELIGYFNEGIKQAEAEILKLDEDYFLTSLALPLVTGVSAYPYPTNMYAFKVRGLMYSNGSTIYPVKKFRRRDKFENMAEAAQYGSADDYRYWHSNDAAGRGRLNLQPPSRETAILPPLANTFAPITLWYIRRANRVPYLGQYVSNWDVLDQSASIDITLNRIAVLGAYRTGDTVKLTSSSAMPGGLVASTVYYVIAGAGYIQLATTLQNARMGTAIDLTATGSGALAIAIAANQSIIDGTVLDIPEFIDFVIQWAKVQCIDKETDPRYAAAAEKLKFLRDQMVSSLTEIQQDDDNFVEADFSSYRDMS